MKTFLIAVVLLAACPAPTNARDYLDDLQKFYRSFPPKRQRAEIERRVRLHPGNAETYILAANWYANDGEHVATLPNELKGGYYSFDSVDATDPNSPKFVLGDEGPLGFQFIRNPASLQRAVEILKAARARFPNRVDIHLGLRQLLDEKGEADAEIEAIESFVAAVKKYGARSCWEYGEKMTDDPIELIKATLWKIIAEKCEGRTPSDQRIFAATARLMVREFPGSEVAWNFLSLACKQQGDVQGNYQTLKIAFALKPDDLIILKNWLAINLRLQLLPAARDAAMRILQLKPDDPRETEAATKTIEMLDRMME